MAKFILVKKSVARIHWLQSVYPVHHHQVAHPSTNRTNYLFHSWVQSVWVLGNTQCWIFLITWIFMNGINKIVFTICLVSYPIITQLITGWEMTKNNLEEQVSWVNNKNSAAGVPAAAAVKGEWLSQNKTWCWTHRETLDRPRREELFTTTRSCPAGE